MVQIVSTKRRACAALAAGLALGLAQAAHADTLTYTYDGLGRVTSVTHSDGTQTNYTYDAAGNRTQQIAVTIPVVVSFSQRIAVGSANNVLNTQVTSSLPYSLAPVGLGLGAGTIPTTGPPMTYTPPASAGTYTFQYTATNSIGTSSPAGVTVVVDPTAHIWGNPSFQWNTSTLW